MRSSVWVSRFGIDQKSWVERCCIPLRAELAAWEHKFNKRHPSHKPTIVQPITPATIGKPTSRLLKLKAAEMKYFFLFLHSKLMEVWTEVHDGQLWLQASRAMSDLLMELDGHPWKLSDDQVQDNKININKTRASRLSVARYRGYYNPPFVASYEHIYTLRGTRPRRKTNVPCFLSTPS